MQAENNNTGEQASNKFTISPAQIIKELRQQVGLSHQFRKGMLVDGQQIKMLTNKSKLLQLPQKKNQEIPQVDVTQQAQIQNLSQPQQVSDQFARQININEKDLVLFTSKLIQEDIEVEEQEIDGQFEIKVNSTMQKSSDNFIERRITIITATKKIIYQDTYQLVPNQDSQLYNQKIIQLEQKHQQDLFETHQIRQSILSETVKTYEKIIKDMQQKIQENEIIQQQDQEKQNQLMVTNLASEQKDIKIGQLQALLQQKQDSLEELEKQVQLYQQLNESLRQQIQFIQQQPQQNVLLNQSLQNVQSPQFESFNSPKYQQQNIIIQRQQSDSKNQSNHQLQQNILTQRSQSSQKIDNSNNIQCQFIQKIQPNNLISNNTTTQTFINQNAGMINSFPNSQEGQQSPILNTVIQQLSQASSLNQFTTSLQFLQQNSQQKISPKKDNFQFQKYFEQQDLQYVQNTPQNIMNKQGNQYTVNPPQDIFNKEQVMDDVIPLELGSQNHLEIDQIEDIFYDESDNRAYVQNSNLSKSKRIQKQDNSISSKSQDKLNQPKKRLAKNVPKNFMKAFRAFMNSYGERQIIKDIKNQQSFDEFESYRTKLNIILQKNKINNEMIIFFIQNEEYKDIFQYFLENRAETWIQTSQLLDKSTHLEYLEIFKKAFNSPFFLNKIKVNQTKNHKPIIVPTLQ